MINNLPAFKFPCTIVCIDDEKLVLDTLRDALEPQNKLICFDNVSKLLEYFKSYSSPLSNTSFSRGYTEHEEYDNHNRALIDFDFRKLINLSNLKSRYDEVAILIADYNMPEVDGLTLCRQINQPQINKILLTGSNDYETAINALNKKIINCFLQKGNNGPIKKLQENIEEQLNHFFNERSIALKNHLEVDHKMPFSDPVFIDFFNGIVKQHNIKEYYLIDKNGSYLMIDAEGNKSCLVVHTNQSLDSFIDLYEEDHGLNKELDELRNRKKIYFFGVGISHDEIDTASWGKHFYPAQHIQGSTSYYLHYLDNIVNI